jgi:hypothetical protein
MDSDFWWKILIGFVVIAIIGFIGVAIYFDATWHKQPWQDDSGRWHENYVCHPYQVTDYAYIYVGNGKSRHMISIPIGHHMEQDCRYE